MKETRSNRKVIKTEDSKCLGLSIKQLKREIICLTRHHLSFVMDTMSLVSIIKQKLGNFCATCHGRPMQRSLLSDIMHSEVSFVLNQQFHNVWVAVDASTVQGLETLLVLRL